MLCHRRWHLVQSANGIILDSSQRHHHVHSSSSNEIRWWRWKSETLISERYPFKGVENYFTSSFLYQDSLEAEENPHQEELDSGNEADTKPEEDEWLWEINLLVTSIGKLGSNTTTNFKGEWFINEDLDLAYFSAFALNFVPLDTSTDMDNNPWSAMNALTSLHAPTKSSLLACEKIGSTHDALFEVPAKQKGKKPILFGQIETEPIAC